MKLLASDLGGTRNPMAVRWPAKIAPDAMPRTQFHHCNDVVPTIYEVVGITPPRVVNGIPQDPIDGASFAYTFDEPRRRRPTGHPVLRDHGQPCDLPRRLDGLCVRPTAAMGARASPGHPRVDARPGHVASCTTSTRTGRRPTTWRPQSPKNSRRCEETFAIEAARNSVYPVGGGLWVIALHPELRISTPYREWNFTGDITRMPEFCAPALGNRENRVTIDADLPESANGVLYALGGAGGGLTCYLDDGYLCYEYNLFILQRTKIRSATPLPAGSAIIEVETAYEVAQPGGPLHVSMSVNGAGIASGGCRSVRPFCSPRTTVSTSACASGDGSPSTTTTGRRFRSQERSKR